jgi:DNA invertase Pin-like site-specific DNA recombinase
MTARKPIVHPYARISYPDQRKGGGLERQTKADVETFAQQFGFTPSKRVLVDDGVSAWKGLNASPQHQLGQFLAEARRGLVPPGDCLLVENYDRLSRQDPWAAVGLVSELRQLGIHIGRLDRMKLLRCDSTDPGDFFEASIEFMRGNSESAVKSDRNGKAWARKRKAALETGRLLTHRLPGWLEERGGKLVLVPERVRALVQIFDLAAKGYGAARIVQKLTREKVPPFGASGKWTRAYIGLLLGDRRVLGEFQPRCRDGTPDGKLLTGYYPAAISEAQFGAAHLARGQRKQQPKGRQGKHADLFAGLLRDARDGGTYYAATRTDGGKHSRVLINTNAAEGREPCRSFPLPTFERAILSRLAELDPHEILNGGEPDETGPLAAELAGVEASIASITAEMDAHGESPTLYARLRQKEARQAELVQDLAAAREKAQHPLSETWCEAQSLLAALDAAPDEVRLRLRAALRRMVDDIWLLVVPKGRDRLCAVQVWFGPESKGHRDYLILHRPPKANGSARQEGRWWVRSLAEVARPCDLDLRRCADARKLEAVLAAMDPIAGSGSQKGSEKGG